MPQSDTEKLAAIDIGSNSIHLAIAERHGDQLRRIASMSEKYNWRWDLMNAITYHRLSLIVVLNA